MSKTEQATLDTGRVKQVPRDYEGQLGNGEDIPTVIESDGDKERCPYCGKWYSKIGSHWSHPNTNCSHPPVSQYKMQWLKGMMLGDGHLNCGNDNRKFPYFEIANTNKTFIHWLHEGLGWLTSRIDKEDATDSVTSLRDNLGRDTQAEDCVDCYKLVTRAHRDFDVFRPWYETGEIVFPEDLIVRRTTLKSWYVSDGGLHWNGGVNACVYISSRNESERPEAIVGTLEDHGFTVVHSGKMFYLSVDDTEDFFDFIGEAPPGFEYKWAYEDRERYNRLKEECREKHCTQTLK